MTIAPRKQTPVPIRNRRDFFAACGAAAALAAAPPQPAFGEDRASPAGEFVFQSPVLPAPDVPLPTDALPPPEGRPLRVAAITTAYWKYSHADDIITKFIEGYAVVGRTHVPHCRVVSLYIEQFPETDIGRGMAARYKIPLFDSPGGALTLGGDDLAADAVLLVGEHGDYPLNDKGQKLYPRRRLFEEIVNVFRKTGKSVPVFSDKHLSFSWENAEWMYAQSKELEFPLMAGSSVPVAWRRPPLALEPGAPLKSLLSVGSGSFESYGFHSLEVLQTFAEKRAGGESGVMAVQALEDEAALAAAAEKKWPAHLLSAAIEPAPRNTRQQQATLAEARPTVFLVEYADGFTAAVCLANRLVGEFCLAAELTGLERPLATWCLLNTPQRDHFSFLCNHIEVMFRTRRPSYPVERTLLVTGVLDALHESRAAGGRRVETPHLSRLAYTPVPDFGAHRRRE